MTRTRLQSFSRPSATHPPTDLWTGLHCCVSVCRLVAPLGRGHHGLRPSNQRNQASLPLLVVGWDRVPTMRPRRVCAPGSPSEGFVRSIWAVAVVVAAVCAWGSATAQQSAEIGLLVCNLSGAVDAEGGGAATATQARHILCAFKLNNGVEEIYTGKAQVLNLPAEEKSTLLWLVKAPSATPAPPGILQQSYSGDPKTPTGQIPDMIGETNSGIVLHSMADKKEGIVSASDGSPALGITVLEVELKLKSTTG